MDDEATSIDPPAFRLDALDLASLSPELRAALARRWREIAALEHASVGSFARFTLQLLAVGAPASLLAEAQQAALDEVEHAKLAFAVASALGGAPVGPGPIAGVGEAVPTDAPSIVRALVEEACVGETLGVAEALAFAEAARDPVMAALHRRIAEDEERHAALAYRTLRWLLERDPGLIEAARAGLAESRSLLEVRIDDAVVDPGAGLFSSSQLAELRRTAFDDVVLPCFAALGVPSP